MAIEIKQFDGSSVTPKDDALMYDLIFNSYGIFNGCGISFLGVNQLRVASGRLIVKGRQVVITEETVAAQLSSSGTKRGRLYIHIDLANQTTPAEFLTQVADELPALTQEDDVNYNDGIFEIELCNYDVSETAISNIVETCPVITGGVDLLSSMEELMANTKPGKSVDALLVKEINESLGGLSFYEDEDGNKYVVGADSVPKKLGSFIPDGWTFYQKHDAITWNDWTVIDVSNFNSVDILFYSGVGTEQLDVYADGDANKLATISYGQQTVIDTKNCNELWLKQVAGIGVINLQTNITSTDLK